MKLETSDLAGFIKERHRLQIRTLPKPTLAIVVTGEEAASAGFIPAKQRYGEDIGVAVRVERVESEPQLTETLQNLSSDKTVTGVVLQLPLPNGYLTERMIGLIPLGKDVDGLNQKSRFESATAKAIMWILASLSINLKDANICVVGQGKLVGAPVSDMLESSGAKVTRCDVNTKDLKSKTLTADVIISGVGQSGLIKRAMLITGAVVIAAGTAEASGKLAGDVDPALYADPDVRVTPVPGGVGPMTVAALFDNLLIAAAHKSAG